MSIFVSTVQKPKHSRTPDQQCDMLTNGIWEIIKGTQKHIWHQLHTLNGTVLNLEEPVKEWKFLSLGKYF